MTRIWWILTWALKSLKNLHFHWFLLCKAFNVWPKKVQRSYLSWHWKVWRKTDLLFGKWNEEYGKFSPEHLKVSKLGLWWDPLIPSRRSMSLKFTQRSYASWHWRMMQNLKRNWFVISKLTWGIWLILTRALESLKNFHFNGLFLNKIYIVWAKKVQSSYLLWHWRVM